MCARRGRIEGILGLYGKCVLESRDEFCVLNTNKSHCERKKLSCRCVCVSVCGWLTGRQLDRAHLWQSPSCVLSTMPRRVLPIIPHANGTSHQPISQTTKTHKHTHACTNTWVCSVICMHTHTQQAACSRPSLLVAVITPVHTGSRCHSQAKMRVGHPLHAQPLHTDTQTYRALY